MNDLSIFVGRKHFDRPEIAGNEDSLKELLENPQKICYGVLPSHILNEYCTQIAHMWDCYGPAYLEPLVKSIKNAM